MLYSRLFKERFKNIQIRITTGDIDAPNVMSSTNDIPYPKLDHTAEVCLRGESRFSEGRPRREVRVVVEAPASIANLGPGFDVLAMAIEGFRDLVCLTVREGSGNVQIGVRGLKVPEGRENVAYRVVEEAIVRYGLDNLDFKVEVVKGVPPAYGLGSSGATAAATAYAISKATALELGVKELVLLSGAGEALVAGTPHYDNVSASILGGIVIVDPVELEVYKIKPRRRFYISIITPNIPRDSKKTSKARSVLPKTIDLTLHTKQSASLARMIHSINRGDLEGFGKALSRDYIVEPSRACLIPEYWSLKKLALESGALGFNIAGAGPSVFSLHRSREEARRVGNILLKYLEREGVEATHYLTRVSNEGVKLLGGCKS